MSDKTNLGYDLVRMETSPAFAPYSKVIAWYDDENAFMAGDDTGRTLEVDLPFATQAIVDEMLERIKGYAYQPWYGYSAILDPAAELGDGVKVNGLYSALGSIETTFDALMTSNVAAPADEEVDHEYHYVTPTNRALKRKVTLGASYHGVSINQTNGLEVTQYDADGTARSRAKLNGDVFAMYDDNGTARLYFDPETGRYKFVGDLDISGGNINMSGGSITWGENKPESGISSGQAKTLITEELVSSPTIAGGQFMDLAQKSWLEMGNSADGRIAYVNHYYDGYDDSDPVMVMGYTNPTGLNPQWVLAPFFNIAMTYMKNQNTMYANGNWDFSQAHTIGLKAEEVGGEYVNVEADENILFYAGEDVVFSALRNYPDSQKVSMRLSSEYKRFHFSIGSTVWVLDESGLWKL